MKRVLQRLLLPFVFPFIVLGLCANIATLALTSSSGCGSSFAKDVKIAGDVAVSCGMDPKLIADMVPVVALILTGGISSWASLMNALHAAYGDVVVCAAEVVRRDEATVATSQPAIAARMARGTPPSSAWLLGGHFVIVYPPPQQLKAPLYGPGGTVVYVPGHTP